MSYNLVVFARSAAPLCTRYFVQPGPDGLPAFSDGKAAVYHPDAVHMSVDQRVAATYAFDPANLAPGKPTHRVSKASVMTMPSFRAQENGDPKRTLVHVGDASFAVDLLKRIFGATDEQTVGVVVRGKREAAVFHGDGWRAHVMPLNHDHVDGTSAFVDVGKLPLKAVTHV